MARKPGIGDLMFHRTDVNPYLRLEYNEYRYGAKREQALREFHATGKLPDGYSLWSDTLKVDITDRDLVDWTSLTVIWSIGHRCAITIPEMYHMSTKAYSSLATQDDMATITDDLRAVGCEVVDDKEAVTVEATDEDGEVVLKAIGKGRQGPYIVTYFNSARISWPKPPIIMDTGRGA